MAKRSWPKVCPKRRKIVIRSHALCVGTRENCEKSAITKIIAEKREGMPMSIMTRSAKNKSTSGVWGNHAILSLVFGPDDVPDGVSSRHPHRHRFYRPHGRANRNAEPGHYGNAA